MFASISGLESVLVIVQIYPACVRLLLPRTWVALFLYRDISYALPVVTLEPRGTSLPTNSQIEVIRPYWLSSTCVGQAGAGANPDPDLDPDDLPTKLVCQNIW